MTHNEKRQSSVREAQIALFTGSIYGAIHTVTGHPLDTIKSNMQVNVSPRDSSLINIISSLFARYFCFRMLAKASAPPQSQRSSIASTASRASFADAGLPS